MQPVAQPELLARQPRPLQWAVPAHPFGHLRRRRSSSRRLPAALLIGPMLAAIIAGTNGATIRPNAHAFMRRAGDRRLPHRASVRPEIFASFYAEWPLFLGIVLATLDGQQPARLSDQPLESAARHHRGLGFDARRGERHGADGRRVRRRCAPRRLHAVSARHLRVDRRGGDRPAVGRHVWRRAPPISGSRRSTGRPLPRRWPRRGRRGGGRAVAVSRRHLPRADDPRHPLHLGGYVELQLPPWLLAVSYAVIGWSIGLNFTRTILRHAARARRRSSPRSWR